MTFKFYLWIQAARYSIDFCLKLIFLTFAEEHISISDDHSLVLACTWINLKASALLAAALVVNFGHQMSPLEIEASGEQRAELSQATTSYCLSPSLLFTHSLNLLYTHLDGINRTDDFLS